MQIPTPQVASENLILLGQFHLAALEQTPETKPFVETFRPAQTDLVAALRARDEALLALIHPRVALRFSEWNLEQVLRALALAAHLLDNQSTSGPAFKALFPEGLNAEIRPRGPAQVETARRVKERLGTQPAAKRLREEHEPKLQAAMSELTQRIEARRKAGEAVGLARAREDGAKETWIAAYDASAGSLRSQFPRQRAHQDLFFDRFRTTSTGSDDADDGIEPAEPGGN